MIFYGKSRFVVLSATSQPIFLGSHYRSCYSNAPPLYEYAGWLSSWRYLSILSLHDVSALAMHHVSRANAIPPSGLMVAPKGPIGKNYGENCGSVPLFLLFLLSHG